MTEQGPAARAPAERPLLRRRNFALYFAGQSLSLLGDAVTPVALAFAVLDVSGSPAALGAVLAAGMAPTVVLVLLGGVVADRVQRRRLMLVCDAVRSLAQGSLALLLLTGTARLWHIIVIQLVSGTGAAFFRPASTGLLPEIVDAGSLPRANGLLGLSTNVSYALGPAVAGTLVALVGSGWALLVDALTFTASTATLAAVRAGRGTQLTGAERPSMLADLAAGWNEFRSRTWLWAIVLWSTPVHLLVLPAMAVLGPVVALRGLGGAPAWATIAACSGIGAVIGGVLSLRIQPRRLLLTACVPLAAEGLPPLLLAGPAPVPAIAAAALLGGVGASMFNIYFLTAMQQQVPAESLSRVSSYDWLGGVALLPLGYALAGPVAALTSVRAVLVAAGVWMLTSTLLLLTVPSVRDLRAVGR